MIPKKRKHPEKRLENWLKKNLHLFEVGMEFIASQYMMYYQIGDYTYHHRIDILAKDKQGIPVIIEVKIRVNLYTLEKQLLPYMHHFPVDCRGIIAAVHIPKWLLCSDLPPNVELWCTKGRYNAKRSCKKSG